MKYRALAIPVLLGMTICACATAPLKVPVGGDVSVLAGRWEGEFTSRDGRRTGSIMFDLRAGRDTAYGDVLLVPEGLQRQNRPPSDAHAAPELVAIRFVMVRDNLVRGTLEPYRDPVCGCRLHTVFSGALKGSIIEGTYRTYHVDTRETHEGSWLVRRTATYADARIDRNHAVGEAQ